MNLPNVLKTPLSFSGMSHVWDDTPYCEAIASWDPMKEEG